jgi:cell division protease FtsH
MIELAYKRAKDILTQNKHLLKLLAEKLLEKEVIFKEDLESIFGRRPFDKEEIPLIKQADKPSNGEVKSEQAKELSDIIGQVKAEEKAEEKKDTSKTENTEGTNTTKDTLF